MSAYYTGVIILAVFSMVIISLITHTNNILEHNKKVQFISLFFMIMLTSVSEWLGIYLNHMPPYTRGFHAVVKIIEFTMAVALPVLCLIIIDYPVSRFMLWGFVVVHFIVEILSAFNGFIFYIRLLCGQQKIPL